jgi:serine/threonine protein kinase
MKLTLSYASFSEAGIKPINQDALGFKTTQGAELLMKGNTFVMADGISSSLVSQDASQSAVQLFLEAYYTTPETWATEKSIRYALQTTNGTLLKRTYNSPYRYDKNKGYVCTFAGLVFKGRHAHIFHLGDTRIHRIAEAGLETLTNDHRVWVSQHQSHLSRALGVTESLEADFQFLPIQTGELFLISTDGIHEFLTPDQILSVLQQPHLDLDYAARALSELALASGSNDNLSIMLISVDSIAESTTENPLFEQPFPLPPDVKEGDTIDGYRILKTLQRTARSHVYLAFDEDHQLKVILKLPSIDLRDSENYREQFLLEEWIANRLDSPYVLKPYPNAKPKNMLYSVMEYIEGTTLKQWILDHPSPNTEEIRNIIEQIGKGLMAMHRCDLLHQDIRPDNIMVTPEGQIKIIDFGSTRVAGLTEIGIGPDYNAQLGTALYSAPEYFLGDGGTEYSDQFSLAVLTYHMFTSRYPYGTAIAKARTLSAQRRLMYQSALDEDREIPVWMDETLKRALQINPLKRYADIPEFLYDLRHPNQAYIKKTHPPLMDRYPKQIWQTLCVVELLFILYLITLITH